MKIIKRSGAEAVFDISKIITAIDKANHEVVQGERLTMEEIHDIAQYIEDAGADMRRSLNVEEIPVSYTHLRAHETDSYLVCRLLLEKKNTA